MSFLLIVGCILIGWVARRKSWLSDNKINALNHYVIWVCLPAIALQKLPLLNLDWTLLYPALMTWFILPVLIITILLLARAYGWNRNVIGCLLMLVCFGNTSFVGFPIIQAFFGKDALAYAVIYDQIGSFLGLAIVGNLIIAWYSERESDASTISLLNLAIKVLTFPPFVAMIVALFSQGWYLTSLVNQSLSLISMTLVPATMILVGAHFNLKVERHYLTPLLWGLSLKMLVAPLLAFVILKLMQQQALSAQVTLMEAAMPPMVTASILAIKAKLAPQLAAVAVGYGIMLAVIVMPMAKLLSSLL
jgi:malate permease and related proteins